MQARIGVAATQAQLDQLPVHTVNAAYVTAVRAAGGLPFVVPTLDPADAPAMVSELDGLVLSGGGDLEPVTYGSSPGPGLDGVDGDRDRWELALVAAAEELGIPVLGICRGLQVLNVAAGGTLIPHLPDVTDRAHWVGERDCEPVHAVAVTTGSLLHAVIGPCCEVNSLHHQAAERVGAGLRASAVAPDGVIEALEDRRSGRVLGVQWHPELLLGQPEQASLLSWLVGSAVTWRARRNAGLAVGCSPADQAGTLVAVSEDDVTPVGAGQAA